MQRWCLVLAGFTCSGLSKAREIEFVGTSLKGERHTMIANAVLVQALARIQRRLQCCSARPQRAATMKPTST